VADSSLPQIDPGVLIAGWRLQPQWRTRVTEHAYPVLGNQAFSRYEFTVLLVSPWLASLLKGILPAVFIMLSGFISLVLGASMEDRWLTLLTSAFVGSLLYHLNLTSSLPAVGYLTFADSFMLVNYAGLLLALVASVNMLLLNEGKQDARALALHQRSRGWIPLIWLLMQGVNVVSFILT
jgi:hypothetical protein